MNSAVFSSSIEATIPARADVPVHRAAGAPAAAVAPVPASASASAPASPRRRSIALTGQASKHAPQCRQCSLSMRNGEPSLIAP